MIVTVFGNPVPMPNERIVGKLQTKVVNAEIPLSVCRCDCGCEVKFKAFAGDSERTSDYSSFIFQRILESDTCEFWLIKNGVEILQVVNNDLGEFYDFGWLANSELKGIVLHWSLVYASYGYGEYRIKMKYTVAGQEIEEESDVFECMLYSDDRADGTVRIETIQNGGIESSLDYTGTNWKQSWRINGMFGEKTPSFETDNYLNSQREISQIQDSIKNIYTLETELLPSNVLNAITYNGILSNKIWISDYNKCNYEVYDRLEVYPESIEEFNTYRYQKNGMAKFKFTDKKQNILKRNFK